ncbi:hypothetical protein H4219_004029 [Mycoemilia scoparia]|uniref:Sodium/nucleoside cotransporter n=1 Tax=Mycoemilia scoparia TaxID=417184 RepID=A0A9W8DSI8_9FUNG|nr:hypothetical protein H4219_004029 [Mycoemilia scoparia]
MDRKSLSDSASAVEGRKLEQNPHPHHPVDTGYPDDGYRYEMPSPTHEGDSYDEKGAAKVSGEAAGAPSEEPSKAARIFQKFALRRWLTRLGGLYRKHKPWVQLVGWLIVTGYFIAALAIRNVTQLSDVLPLIFFYAFITLRLLFWNVSIKYVTRAIRFLWDNLIMRPAQYIPMKIQLTVLYLAPFVAFLIIALTLSKNEYGDRLSRLQGFLGMVVIIFVMAMTSRHPTHIQWHTVAVGQTLQLIFGLIVLKTTWGFSFFQWIAQRTADLLHFGSTGCAFLLSDDICKNSGYFMVTVFPALIFFASLIQMAYYVGLLQWVVAKSSWLFTRVMDTSGAESVVAVASPFVGMSENALLVRTFIPHMTESELHTVLAAGFSTISGSVMSGYIAMGVPVEYIITSCIMSVPCSLAMSKLRIPETEESMTKGRTIEPESEGDEQNLLHAAGNGANNGMTLCLLIAATIIAVISLLNLVNFILTWLGNYLTIHELTIQLILGYVFYPFTWLLGVRKEDVLDVSQLLATKVIANEFVAYKTLTAGAEPPLRETMDPRSNIIATFALCGFANIGSIGIQVGSIGAIAPNRKGDLARLAVSACITGFVATCMSALIAGMLV